TTESSCRFGKTSSNPPIGCCLSRRNPAHRPCATVAPDSAASWFALEPGDIGLVAASSTVTDCFVLVRYEKRQRHHLSGEDVVVSVDQLDLHLVLPGGQPGYV